MAAQAVGVHQTTTDRSFQTYEGASYTQAAEAEFTLAKVLMIRARDWHQVPMSFGADSASAP